MLLGSVEFCIVTLVTDGVRACGVLFAPFNDVVRSCDTENFKINAVSTRLHLYAHVSRVSAHLSFFPLAISSNLLESFCKRPTQSDDLPENKISPKISPHCPHQNVLQVRRVIAIEAAFDAITAGGSSK